MGWQNNVFNQLIIEGSNSGIFIYDGAPGLGTLIGSWAAVAGVDAYGNTYPQGLYVATSALINNATIVMALINQAQITASTVSQSAVFESTVTFDSNAGVLLMYTLTTITDTIPALTTSWTSPAGTYTSGYVRVWGSGASGNGGVVGDYSGAANGGGGYAENPAYPLTPSTNYTVAVAQGGFGIATGNTGKPGGTATFDVTQISGPSVSASGGKVTSGSPGGGIGGSMLVGTTGYNGGRGGITSFHPTSLAGGGGGAGGPGGPGGDGGQDGPGGVSHGGGKGGTGGTENGNGVAGTIPGGAGGGAGYATSGSNTSGPGGDGRITVVLNTATEVLVGAASPVAGTDALGNAYGAGFTGPTNAFHPGSNPTTVEVPQQVFLDGGWSNVGDGIKYWLGSDGMVHVFGAVTRGTAFTGAQVINSTHAIPSAYWPSVSRNIGGAGIPGRAGCEITAAGVFTAEANGTSCTEVDISGFYPLY